jgi:hypothetical protein
MMVMTVFLCVATVKCDCHLTCYSKALDILAQWSDRRLKGRSPLELDYILFGCVI